MPCVRIPALSDLVPVGFVECKGFCTKLAALSPTSAHSHGQGKVIRQAGGKVASITYTNFVLETVSPEGVRKASLSSFWCLLIRPS